MAQQWQEQDRAKIEDAIVGPKKLPQRLAARRHLSRTDVRNAFEGVGFLDQTADQSTTGQHIYKTEELGSVT